MTYVRDKFYWVLVYHQRKDISGCICGWAVLGASHPNHVLDEYEKEMAEDHPHTDDQCCLRHNHHAPLHRRCFLR